MLEEKWNHWKYTFGKLGILCGAGVLFWSFYGKASVNAVGQKALEHQVRERTKRKILRTYLADYDGDGKKEAFIVTKKDSAEQTLWFSGQKQVKKLAVSSFILKRGQACKVSEKQKLFVIEGWNGGSSSWSYCISVSGGKCHSVKESGEGLTQLSGRDFVVYPSSFDACRTGSMMTGHTWKAYYLRWNGKKFVNYTGTLMTSENLEKYEGADHYLAQIKKAGYKIGKIYFRKNGIININLYRKDKYLVSYENVTLKKKGQKVDLVVHTKNGKDIVEKSSYGGIYRSETVLLEPGYV